MQADESTDISGRVQLLGFISYVNYGKIAQQIFGCKDVKKGRPIKIFWVLQVFGRKRIIVERRFRNS